MDDQLYRKFLEWERATRDTIDFKKIYADMAGDILAGLVLSEIVYWHLPNAHGQSKMRVNRGGFDWIACPRYEWWDRTRLTPRQIDRIIKQLVKLNLVVKKSYHFAGSPTMHVRINWEAFFLLWNSLIENPLQNPYAPEEKSKPQVDEYAKPSAISPNGKLPNGEIHITENVKTYTETTNNKEKEMVAVPAKKSRQPDPVFDAISIVWDTKAGGFIGNIKAMLTGTAKGNDAWARSQLEPPATADEILEFGQWAKGEMRRKNLKKMITSPVTIERWFEDFRKSKRKIVPLRPEQVESVPIGLNTFVRTPSNPQEDTDGRTA